MKEKEKVDDDGDDRRWRISSHVYFFRKFTSIKFLPTILNVLNQYFEIKIEWYKSKLYKIMKTKLNNQNLLIKSQKGQELVTWGVGAYCTN